MCKNESVTYFSPYKLDLLLLILHLINPVANNKVLQMEINKIKLKMQYM